MQQSIIVIPLASYEPHKAGEGPLAVHQYECPLVLAAIEEQDRGDEV